MPHPQILPRGKLQSAHDYGAGAEKKGNTFRQLEIFVGTVFGTVQVQVRSRHDKITDCFRASWKCTSAMNSRTSQFSMRSQKVFRIVLHEELYRDFFREAHIFSGFQEPLFIRVMLSWFYEDDTDAMTDSSSLAVMLR